MSSNHQFVVTDIDFQQLQQDDERSPTDDAEIKEEDVNREELFYFTQTGQYPQRMDNFEVVQTVGNTVSIPEGSTFTIPFNSDEMNQLLLAGAGSENGVDAATMAAGFPKIPVDLANFFKMNGVKNEQSIGSAPHYVKYKPDENGKHIKIWECGICHKEFGHQYILMRHLPTHTDERKFQCKQCGKAFRQMSTLSQHRAIHSKLRPYICEVCQKTFNRVSTLISHRKTHTGLKPHRCHLCNKAFHQKGNLRNHIFTHTNERPYKCDVCQKGFNQMSNLMCHKHKAHQRVDKPKYTCQTCGKEFEKRIGLRNHEQYEHGEPAASGSSSNAPSVKYTNGVIVAPINTAAMKIAVATNQVPFALLRPLNGIPVLVRVLPAGDKQMLVPATAEDLKKFGEITIKKKEEGEEDGEEDANKENVPGNAKLSESDNTAIISGTTGDIEKGATVQIRIPVVASVVQRCRDGTMHMDIESPGPRREGTLDDSFVITATEDGEIAKEGEGIVQEIDELIETLNSPTACEEPRDCHTPVNTMNGDMQNRILQKDVALNQQNVQIFDADEVVLTPVLNLDGGEQDILLPSGMFGTAPAAGMYEIDPEADESHPSN